MYLFIEILVLAIIQGIAEFLPISSSGHLVIGSAIFDAFGAELQEKLAMGIVLHVGTLLAILVFYWRRILRLLTSDRRVIPLLIVGSIPAGVVGILLKDSIERIFEEPIYAGVFLIITGVILLLSKRCKSGETECRNLSYLGAFLIGLSQAFAILPGISRSGSTIVAGLGLGMKREEAATFSFLLAIPAIGGAGLIHFKDLLENPAAQTTPLLPLLIGGLVSFVVGLAALAWLIRWLQEGRLQLFAWWLFIVGPAVIVWQVVVMLK
ncbi:MAG: undecaprenyl-diphosphate phosphatase [Planctomycetia bacterium]|jgi:undecaprenyl-diphosphatase